MMTRDQSVQFACLIEALDTAIFFYCLENYPEKNPLNTTEQFCMGYDIFFKIYMYIHTFGNKSFKMLLGARFVCVFFC